MFSKHFVSTPVYASSMPINVLVLQNMEEIPLCDLASLLPRHVEHLDLSSSGVPARK